MTPKRLAALAGVFLIALLITHASAEGPLQLDLRLELRHADDSDGACTAGRTAEVFWSTMRGDQPVTEVRIDGVLQEGRENGIALVRCPALRSDWRIWAARYGMPELRRVVAGVAVAPDGRELRDALTLEVLFPLPVPADIAVSSHWHPGLLEFEFRDAGLDEGRVAARWRDAGGGEWRIGPSTSRDVSHGGGGRQRAEIVAWLDAGIYELQLARIRSEGEIPGLAEADWSEAVVLDLSNEPPLVTAESTHDQIIIRSAEGAAVAAHRWQLLGPCRGDDGSARRSYPACPLESQLAADAGEPDIVRWDSLVPDSGYYLSWLPAGRSGELSRYLFPVRTEPAPDGYAPDLAATDGKTVQVGPRSVSLQWESPPQARHPYRVSAYEFGASHAAYAVVELVEEAGAVHDVVLDGLRPGAAYRIEVIRERPDGMKFGTRFIIETPEDDGGGVLEDRPEVPVAEYGARPEYYRFLLPDIYVEVPDSERWMELELEWRLGEWTMRRLSSGRLWLTVPLPGIYQIRARGRNGGPWSEWSEPAVVATTPLPPSLLRGAQTKDGALISWSPDRTEPVPDEYVVRWSIDGGPETETRGAADPRIVLPVAADAAGTLRVTVAAAHSELGEGEQSVPFEMPLGRPLTAAMSSSQWYPCLPEEGAPCPVSLSIRGGMPPYETRVGERMEMVDGGYRLEVDYDMLADERGIGWEVRDALGATVSGTYRRQPPELDPDAVLPRRFELGRLHAALEGEIAAVWHCRPVRSAWYVTRWREAGRPHWLYAIKPKREGRVWVDHRLGIGWHHQGCLYLIDGLQPGVAYEVGVGAVRSSDVPFDPDVLRWSETWVVTVPAEIEGVWVSREEAGTQVSWPSQPGVRRYVVVLRGEGRNWSRVHYSTGAERESALFDIPPAAAYSAEVLMPDGAEGGPVALSAS